MEIASSVVNIFYQRMLRYFIPVRTPKNSARSCNQAFIEASRFTAFVWRSVNKPMLDLGGERDGWLQHAENAGEHMLFPYNDARILPANYRRIRCLQCSAILQLALEKVIILR